MAKAIGLLKRQIHEKQGKVSVGHLECQVRGLPKAVNKGCSWLRARVEKVREGSRIPNKSFACPVCAKYVQVTKGFVFSSFSVYQTRSVNDYPKSLIELAKERVTLRTHDIPLSPADVGRKRRNNQRKGQVQCHDGGQTAGHLSRLCSTKITGEIRGPCQMHGCRGTAQKEPGRTMLSAVRAVILNLLAL